jgi:hypothetical protein
MNLKLETLNLKLGIFALLLSSFILPPSSFAAESPTYIPFQGQVTNQTGTIVADGQYSIIFNLYDQAVGGQPVWSERHVKIGVTRGMVNVFLGSISPLTSVDFSQTKYLGITVDTDNLATTADPEMVPRSLIMPAFFSKNTSKMLGYDWSSLFQDGSSQPTNNIAGGSLKPSLFGNNSIDASKLINGSVGFPSLSSDVISSLGGSLTQGSLVSSMTALEAIADRNAVAITKDAGNNTRLFKANSSVGSRSAFYGFAKGAAAINAPVTIHQFGALDGFIGLTAGSSYYLGTTDGAITASYPAGNPIYVGYALTGTTLFVDPFGVTKKWANQNFWGNASDGAVSTTGDVNLASTLDGDVVVKQYSSLTINAGHTMTVANRCRGLVIYVDGSCTINGTLTMTARGANVDPTLANSIPATGIRLVRRKAGATETLLTGSDLGGTGAGGVGNDWRTYEALQPPINNDGKIYSILRTGGGGGGGIGSQNNGIPGQSVVNGLGGGGGGGSTNSGGGNSGGGSAGTCYSGGAGGGGNWGNGNVGNAGNGGANGGAGGNGVGNSSFGGGGGAGNPAGSGPNNGNGQPGTGGLLILLVRGNLTIGSAGTIQSNGSMGGSVFAGSGGGSGGGYVLVLHAGALANSGLMQANGGAGGPVAASIPGGAGGNGTVITEQISP